MRVTKCRLVSMCALSVSLLCAVFIGAPLQAAEGYRVYAEGLLNNLPAGAQVRQDLEAYLNRLASEYRTSRGGPPLEASQLLARAARAQAVEMIKGDFVGHHSASGYRFSHRFLAFGGDDRGDRGENAARERSGGPADAAKARRLFNQWVQSRGHRRNMTNVAYNYVSTGVIEIRGHLYAVQIFWQK